jgi:hypothetical protein
MLVNSSERLSEIFGGKWASKFNRMRWGRLMSPIYGNPVETEVNLIARILSVCVNFQKIGQVHLRPYTADIVRHLQDYSEVTGSQFDSSCELLENNTAEIYS